MIPKKRMAIMILYSHDGVFDHYVDYLAKSISKVVERIILVVNGSIVNDSYERLSAITKDIYIRDNFGFDGGAYKDTIINYLSAENWEKWDELILLNDTFYGPFYNWEHVFQIMEKKGADLWGLSTFFSDFAGKPNVSKKKWSYHIQSYFLVFNRIIISSPCFFDFWMNLDYPGNYQECIEKFEIGLSIFFLQNGFKCTSYIEENASEYKKIKNISLFNSYSDDLIMNYGYPVLKYKFFSNLYPRKSDQLLRWIEMNSEYPIDLIKEHQGRLDCEERLSYYSVKKLSDFIYEHKTIYLFGYGKMARIFTDIFNFYDWKFEKYVVSEKIDDNDMVINLNELDVNDETGIVLSIGKKSFDEVFPKIRKLLKDQHIFCLRY